MYQRMKGVLVHVSTQILYISGSSRELKGCSEHRRQVPWAVVSARRGWNLRSKHASILVDTSLSVSRCNCCHCCCGGGDRIRRRPAVLETTQVQVQRPSVTPVPTKLSTTPPGAIITFRDANNATCVRLFPRGTYHYVSLISVGTKAPLIGDREMQDTELCGGREPLMHPVAASSRSFTDILHKLTFKRTCFYTQA